MKRREFLKAAGSAGVGLFGANILAAGTNTAYQPPQQGSAVDGFSVAPLSKVRVAVIGVGARGSGHVGHLSAIDGVEVKAVCDLYQDWADRAVKRVTDAGHDAPETYVGGDLEYRKMLDRDDIDAVFIATPWEWHTPMAVDAMNRGKHVFIEVPAAITIEECWELVDVAEKNQVHCMMSRASSAT
jgi:predicted dehydrogenase